jgi:hypothetical protein
MVLLLDCHSLGGWPKHVTTKAIGNSGGNVVLGHPPLISAGGNIVDGANWMEFVQTAVGAHVPDLLHLGLPAHVIAAAAFVGATVGIPALIVGHLCGHGGNGGSELLDLALHCCQFFLRLHVDGVVCRVGCDSACLLLDLLPDLVAVFVQLVGRFLAIAFSRSSIRVLLIGVCGLDNALEVGLSQVLVRFCGCWLLLPR